MKLSRTVLAAVCAFGSSTLYAASLNIPMAFEFLAVNGKQVEKSMVVHQDELQLAPGYHEIAIRYYDMVEGMSDTLETVKSSPFIISLNATGDSEYFLEPAGSEVIRRPVEYAESPEIVITSKDGSAVDYKFTQTDITQREFASRLYGKDEVQPAQVAPVAVAPMAPAAPAATSAATGSQQLVSTPVAAGAAPVAAAAPTPAPAAAGAGENAATPGDMLQMWWQRADEKTRKEFLSWAVQQL